MFASLYSAYNQVQSTIKYMAVPTYLAYKYVNQGGVLNASFSIGKDWMNLGRGGLALLGSAQTCYGTSKSMVPCHFQLAAGVVVTGVFIYGSQRLMKNISSLEENVVVKHLKGSWNFSKSLAERVRLFVSESKQKREQKIISKVTDLDQKIGSIGPMKSSKIFAIHDKINAFYVFDGSLEECDRLLKIEGLKAKITRNLTGSDLCLKIENYKGAQIYIESYKKDEVIDEAGSFVQKPGEIRDMDRKLENIKDVYEMISHFIPLRFTNMDHDEGRVVARYEVSGDLEQCQTLLEQKGIRAQVTLRDGNGSPLLLAVHDLLGNELQIGSSL